MYEAPDGHFFSLTFEHMPPKKWLYVLLVENQNPFVHS